MARKPTEKSGLYDVLAQFLQPVPVLVRTSVLIAVTAVAALFAITLIYMLIASVRDGRQITLLPFRLGPLPISPIQVNCDHFIQELEENSSKTNSTLNSLMSDIRTEQ